MDFQLNEKCVCVFFLVVVFFCLFFLGGGEEVGGEGAIIFDHSIN